MRDGLRLVSNEVIESINAINIDETVADPLASSDAYDTKLRKQNLATYDN